MEHAHLARFAARVIEVCCQCPDNELRRRFAVRARTAHPAHVLKELPDEVLAQYGGSMGVGEVIEVDTSRPVDVAALVARLECLIG
ncbi:hypothetical protein [Fodinicola feengrottensis]|nr:hypothetical protein [Fodinicola feengrottensis]